MPKRTRRSRAEIAEGVLPLDQWPALDYSTSDIDMQKKMDRRVRALHLYYCRLDYSLAAIVEITKVDWDGAKLTVQARRARSQDRNGQPYCFKVCLDDFKPQRGYQRTKVPARTLNGHGGDAGALGFIFQAHPTIETSLAKLALDLIDDDPTFEKPLQVSTVTCEALKNKLHRLCRQVGMANSDWPLSRKKGGYEAVRHWWQNLKLLNPTKAINVDQGQDAANNAAHVMVAARAPSAPPPIVINERWEADAQEADSMYSVTAMVDGRKRVIAKGLRPKVYAIADRGGRCNIDNVVAFLGHVNPEWHILRAVRQALDVHRRHPTVGDLQYPDGPCFPSEVRGWRPFRPANLAWDALSTQKHLALEQRLHWAAGICCGLEISRRGIVRAGVEGGFRHQSREFEHGSNATGSEPSSASRREPEKASIEYKAECAALASDLIFAERNTKRPKGAPNSPIEDYAQALASQEGLFVPLELSKHERLHWSLGPSFLCTLRRDKGVVYLQAMEQKYSSTELMAWPGIGDHIDDDAKKLKLFVMDDASQAMACVRVDAKGGAYEALFKVKVYGSRRWRSQHTLIERWLTYQLPQDLGRCVTQKGMSVGVAIAAALTLDSRENPSWLAFGLADVCALRRQLMDGSQHADGDLPDDPNDRSELPQESTDSGVRLDLEGVKLTDDSEAAWVN